MSASVSPSTSSSTRKRESFAFLKVIDRGDVRMIERGEDFGFALEAAHTVGIARKLIRQDLDGDFALQLRIACAIDLAHSALAD